MFRLTPVVQTLLLINVAMLAVPWLVGGEALNDTLNSLLGLKFYNSPFFKPYQFFTYMFMHSGFMHLLFNMLGLVFFGNLLEQIWGSQRFLLYYVLCGLGAGVIYVAVNYFHLAAMQNDMEAFLADPSPANFADYLNQYYKAFYQQNLEWVNAFARDRTNPVYLEVARNKVQEIYALHLNGNMVGASGAVYGILVATGILFPNLSMIVFPIPIPIKAKFLVLGLGVMALYNTLNQAEGDQVAHLAHLGGMVVGIVVLLVWSRGRWPEAYN